jgi:uncharacterized membrane protein
VIGTDTGRPPLFGRLVAQPARRARTLALESSLSAASAAVYAGAAVWAVLFGGLAWARYEGFLAGRFDLGNMVQAVWSTADGHPLRVIALDGNEIIRPATHVDLILVGLAPLWLVWSSPVMLLAVQAAALALGALPVYWLARKHLASPRLGAALAFGYLLYAPVQWIQLFDFHAVTFAVPLILFAIWFLDEDRLVPFAVMAGLALVTKEEIGLVVAGLGLWYAVRRGGRLAGALIVGGSLGWTVIALKVIIPLSSGGRESPFLVRYSAVGGSPEGFLKMLVTDPGTIFAAVTTSRDLVYLALLLVPLLGLWALEPLLAAVALPAVALNLLSSHEAQTSISYQYVSGIVPFLIAASVIGLGRLRARHPKAMRLATLSLVSSMVWYTILLGPLVTRAPEIVRAFDGAHTRAAQHAVALIPPGDAVSVTNQVGAHLSARRKVYMFPVVKDAHWVVVDRVDPFHTAHGDRAQSTRFARQLARLSIDPRFERVFHDEGISVFERGSQRMAGG